ncbi:inner centromere protein [Amylocystis lapponica]|nr:inner centromere protein [Amylocystis lapponica]
MASQRLSSLLRRQAPQGAQAAKGKGKGPSKDDDVFDQQPAPAVQSQTANRVKAQMQAPQPPPITSESIELPDINSEYSDSDDEDRPRTFDPPGWAQSPELRQALEQQSTMNPDDIFGRIGPLRMEEIFRTRQSRFRARTSSANWTGTDQLTAEEEREYARRMGFR